MHDKRYDDKRREGGREGGREGRKKETYRPTLLHKAIIKVISRGGPIPMPALLFHRGNVDIKGRAFESETELLRGGEVLVAELLAVVPDGWREGGREEGRGEKMSESCERLEWSPNLLVIVSSLSTFYFCPF